jgi:hypothetical protein
MINKNQSWLNPAGILLSPQVKDFANSTSTAQLKVITGNNSLSARLCWNCAIG